MAGGLESKWTKLITVPGLILTSVVTILLLWTDQHHWTDTGELYRLVNTDRSTVQLAVQVLASCFGAIHAYTLCVLLNFSTRLWLAKQSYSLDLLKFWRAMCSRSLEWSLPTQFLIPLLIFQLALVAPAAFYAGALTPVVSSTTTPADLKVPRYSDSSKASWGNLKWTTPMQSVWNGSIFTYSPNYDLQGLLLNNAASATYVGNVTRAHSKIDNTGYSYSGRSYGVASSVGLMDRFKNSTRVLGYQYDEAGYTSNASCIVNATSDWAIAGPVMASTDSTYPNVYLVSGTLANGNGERYSACGLRSSNEVFALVGSTLGTSSVFAIAAGRNYAAFDKIQCNVIFTPSIFSVTVDAINRLVTVAPLARTFTDSVPDIEPTGFITSFAMRLPTSISQQHACDLYTSLVGNTFAQNVRNAHPSFQSSKDSSNLVTGVLHSVEDSLASLLDDSLLALSSAQLMIANDAVDAPTTLSISAVRIGESRYIYVVAAIHFAIVLLYLVELLRTRMWKGLIKFDYMDIKSVIVGAAIGGSVIVRMVRTLYEKRGDGWHGDPGDRVAGKMMVKLEQDGAGTRLVGNEHEDEDFQFGPRIRARKAAACDVLYDPVPSETSMSKN